MKLPGEASLVDRLKTYALGPLPQHALSRAVYWLTRRRNPLVTPVVRRFASAYDVDMHDAVEPDLAAYESFNAFFTRALRQEARPIAAGDDVIACPADGRVSGIARVRDARVLQAKGHDYSLVELLGGDAEAAARFEDGAVVTVYLSPRDYHRLHMPATGRLLSQTRVRGRLWSVGPHAVRALPGLFASNERVIAQFDTAHGRMALVLVGAMNVAAIETVWHGLVTPASAPSARTVPGAVSGAVSGAGSDSGSAGASGVWRIDYVGEEQMELERGAEMGRFNMGSTIVAVFERDVVWRDDLEAESPVKMGELLGRFR